MVVGQLTIETDVAIIGGGPGGYVAAIRAADLGLTVTLVEKRDRLGGMCLLEGCIPSKSLIHAANLLKTTRDAGKMGLHFGDPKIDLDELRKWKDSVIDGLTKGVDSLLKNRGVEVVHGHGHFVGGNKISVEEADVTIEYKSAIIAAGSRDPDIPDGYPDDLWSTSDALQLIEIPNRLLIFTNEYYGFEFAQIYAALGSKVTVVDPDPDILPGTDKDLVDVMIRYASRGFEAFLPEAKITGIKKIESGYSVSIEDKKGPRTVDCNRVILANTRKPNTPNLGLEHTKAVLDESGFIKVDETCKTDDQHIFAIGDVTPGPMFAYRAAREGKVAAEVIAGRKSAMDNRAIAIAVFTDPEIAWTGLTERAAQAANTEYAIDKFPLKALGQAHIFGRTEGFIKVLHDPKSGLILGTGIVGPLASEIITEATLAIEMGATLEDLTSTLHPHPSMSESIMEAIEVASGTPVHIFQKKPK